MASRALREHQKILGIALLLVALVVFTGAQSPAFLSAASLKDLLRYTGLYGILAVGVALVIATGGIDLSIGSLVALSAVLLPVLLGEGGLIFAGPVSVPVAMGTILGLCALVGLAHGLLITKLNLQPFLVTLCGLFIYRGMARRVAGDESKGFAGEFEGLRQLAKGQFLDGALNPWRAVHETAHGVPIPFLILVILAAAGSVYLHRTVWGRHTLALGRNEEAARFSGVPTHRRKIAAYVLCSTVTGVGGMLWALETSSVQASNYGNSYELYAIAGAVLGGCSLRGGEASMVGVILGAALVQVSTSAVLFLQVADSWKFAVIGSLILVGVIADELLRRFSRRRTAGT